MTSKKKLSLIWHTVYIGFSVTNEKYRRNTHFLLNVVFRGYCYAEHKSNCYMLKKSQLRRLLGELQE